MSLESWIEEFYPIEANYLTETDLIAINHCIKKWKGALPENLEKHRVKYKGHTIFNKENDISNYLEFYGSSCALCYKYAGDCIDQTIGPTCPIVRMLGKTCNEVYNSSESDPKPMLELLHQTKKFVEDGN